MEEVSVRLYTDSGQHGTDITSSVTRPIIAFVEILPHIHMLSFFTVGCILCVIINDDKNLLLSIDCSRVHCVQQVALLEQETARVCRYASTVQYVKRNLLLLVTSASDLLRCVQLNYSVLFSSL